MSKPLLMSGHCNFPATEVQNKDGSVSPVDREYSHRLCALPLCPCPCHFPGEELECECGGVLKEAPHWPEDPDYPGEPVYTHIDRETGRAIGEECP